MHNNNNKMRLCRAFIAWIMLSLAMTAEAAAGEINILDARSTLDKNIYNLHAHISYQLGDEMLVALSNGVVLPIRLDIEVYRPRKYWTNDVVAELRQHYELRYHVLSEQYIVANLNSGASESFGYLSQALAALGNINALPIIDKTLLDEGVRYKVRARSVVASEELSIPLRLMSLFYDEWSLESEWVSWAL